jgi:succinoglycan biosynthesis protein ExoA
MDITVAVTTFNEGAYLDRLLMDLALQRCALDYEIIIVEAGEYDEARARRYLGAAADRLIFITREKLSRTRSLNLIFDLSRGDLVVRLDARSHVSSDYLEKIYILSSKSGAASVGGVMLPVGLDERQSIIANIMKHPLSFGGAKARKRNYRGNADSVYLGAFRKSLCVYGDEWFDSTHPRISEDSDLNYRLRKNGGKVFVDSSIVVQHFPRENLTKFFRLCFNYGIGRGLFIIKNRVFSAYRQLIPPAGLVVMSGLFFLSQSNPIARYVLFGLLGFYFFIVAMAALSTSRGARQFTWSFFGFVGCHVFWTLGLFISPAIYRRDLSRSE